MQIVLPISLRACSYIRTLSSVVFDNGRLPNVNLISQKVTVSPYLFVHGRRSRRTGRACPVNGFQKGGSSAFNGHRLKIIFVKIQTTHIIKSMAPMHVPIQSQRSNDCIAISSQGPPNQSTNASTNTCQPAPITHPMSIVMPITDSGSKIALPSVMPSPP